MSIEIPTKTPELIKTIESDFGTTISEAIWLKIINNQTWVERNIPIGFVLYYFANQALGSGLVDVPINNEIWTFCDGSIISDSDSPLDGQNAPDLRDRFLKGSATIGNIGGAATANLAHSHGGATGITDDRGPQNADNNFQVATGFPHSHTITSDLDSTENIIPLHTEVQAFMRYK